MLAHPSVEVGANVTLSAFMESAVHLEIDPDLPATPRKREAEEWALVLEAEGIPARVVRHGAYFCVAIRPSDRERVEASIAAWHVERSVAVPLE